MKIGYISYRLQGNDGVSLEAERWRTILERMGHTVQFVDNSDVPLLFFGHPDVQALHDPVIYGNKLFDNEIIKAIFAQAGELYTQLIKTIDWTSFDRLIVANCFSLPMHFSASVALDKLVSEYKIPTISRNHDFWWERPRFTRKDCEQFFNQYFVPINSYLKHVTINSIAQRGFFERGYESTLIPDTFDFESELDKKTNKNTIWRHDYGISNADVVFLQATRIISRKKIEWAMEMIQKLEDPRAVLVLAGQAGDEDVAYLRYLENFAEQLKIRAVFIGEKLNNYNLWDCFVNADWMTYPSDFEGFGNQFIEGVYFKKPIFVNRYEVYKSDIEPLGFETVSMDGEVTDEVVWEVKRWMNDLGKIQRVVEKNYEIAKANFSYEATTKRLFELV